MDMFILYHDDSGTKLRNDHFMSGYFAQWRDRDLVLPVQEGNVWEAYPQITVNLLHRPFEYLQLEFSEHWKTPDQNLKCPPVDDATVSQWMNELIELEAASYRKAKSKKQAEASRSKQKQAEASRSKQWRGLSSE